jgi:S1-C subfamily serine protease
MTEGAAMKAFPRRALMLALAGLAAAGIATGVALAHSTPASSGSGVVVIETNLAYQDGAAAGTGIVLTRGGKILTNNHVIRGATTIKVVVPGTLRSYRAKVVGYDVADDVAVLQVDGAANLKTSALATSTPVVGQVVTAVGNAGGTGSLTSARGRITGLGRSIQVGDDQGGIERLSGLIETDAGLQPGDSGGPLMSGGKVIGMDTAASTGSGYGPYAAASNDGYAIPIAKAMRIVEQIDSRTSSATVHIGATAFLGVEIDASNGYDVIAAVVPGGPAGSAGLAPGDVITAIGGRAVSSPTALAGLLFSKKPGDRVTVTYSDGYGATQTTTVTLATVRPSRRPTAQRPPGREAPGRAAHVCRRFRCRCDIKRMDRTGQLSNHRLTALCRVSWSDSVGKRVAGTPGESLLSLC